MGLHGAALPDFPWDCLIPFRQRAAVHPGGLVDLSVGTPVDPTPAVAQVALQTAADSPGYPAAAGTPALRQAIVEHYRRRGATSLNVEAVLPTIGSKEAVSLLPALLGLGAGDVVVLPQAAYPSYDIGARLAGAEPWPADDLATLPAAVADRVKLIWLNSPANPHGRVLSLDQLAAILAWATDRGVVVASDECYAELAWTEPWLSEGVPSLLDDRLTGGDLTGCLALYSLSKQSNLAGYRAAWIAGDPALIASLREVRRHIGLMMPGPVQQAMTAVLGQADHVRAQRERYGERRRWLAAGLADGGYVIDGSEAGLYLWTRAADGRDGWQIVADLAELGILVAPGEFYGVSGRDHVRIALTGSDEDITKAVSRLGNR
jgi:succinyldiaminopimelate transaminase